MDNEMDGKRNAHEETDKRVAGKSEGRDHWGDQGVNRR
jgi:hypothetical protein